MKGLAKTNKEIVPCTKCGDDVERVSHKEKATCFECKRLRITKTTYERYRLRKGNNRPGKADRN